MKNVMGRLKSQIISRGKFFSIIDCPLLHFVFIACPFSPNLAKKASDLYRYPPLTTHLIEMKK